ncbi:MAG TPA: GHMP kinase [Candidatus Angelobacter sp.]|nr:GHMP kinase [Candidatus Angelobacter sp.]
MSNRYAISLPTNSEQIYAQAPCRADLAGSTIDLWPLYLFHPGSVTVNMAVDIQTTCKITPRIGRTIHLKSVDTGREDRFASLGALMKATRYRHALAAYLVRFFQPGQGFLLESHSESPAGAGISGSSAMMISTSAALARFVEREIDIEQIRVIAQNVEAQLIRVPTGCQDYYPAMYGGANAVHLDTDGIHCEPIAIPAEELNQRFVLLYTGAPRQSGINNWEVFKQHINGDKHVIRNFAEISRIAREMHAALKAAKWSDVERLLNQEWKLRRTNAPGITTPLIDKLIAAAKKQGARAAKVCGAGGGGCVIVLIEPGTRDRVHQAICQNGGQPLDFQISQHGLRFFSPAQSMATR